LPSLELLVNLYTEKGTKYIAGVLRLETQELSRQQGQTMVLGLSKCLDSEATCEFKVERAASNQKGTFYTHKSTALAPEKNQVSPHPSMQYNPPRPQNSKATGGTKSEFQFPISVSRQLQSFRTK
jgi:hypothetical protein